jgi:Flp pilus assembly protein CpaB
MRLRIRRRVIARRRLLPRRVRHHPLVRAAVVLAVIGLAWSVVQRTAATALDARDQWGRSQTVVVARERIVIGDTIDGAAVATESWPAAMVPEGAVTQSPVGQTVIATIEPGEAVNGARLAPDGLRGVAALVPSGRRALAIPVGPTVVDLSVGDQVDLIAGFDAASASGGRAPAFTVAERAVVVAVDERRVTVAVDADDATRVAFAIVAGTVVPALRTT